ncbi:hypothetical protein K505DRAFT_196988, partial [Melanomma pulvis-pyrius CBS 109.77]
ILLCLWTMLHLNLPAPDDTMWTNLRDKAGWMLFGLFFPELIVCFAYAQWRSALESVKDMKSQGITSEDWTIVHAFYADMGGFRIKPLDFGPFPATAKQLHSLVRSGDICLPTIQEREIADRSKGNWVIKGLAAWQVAGAIIAMCIRWSRRLAVTPIEIITAMNGICALVTIGLWWKKPLDVETAITIPLPVRINDLLRRSGPAAARPWIETPLDFAERDIYMTQKWSKWSRELTINMGIQSRPLKRLPNDRDFRPKNLRHNLLLAFPVTLFGAVNIYSGFAFTFPTPTEQKAWIILSI